MKQACMPGQSRHMLSDVTSAMDDVRWGVQRANKYEIAHHRARKHLCPLQLPAEYRKSDVKTNIT